MNERIKEIEDQCWEHEPSWTGVDKLVFNREKFAELIVRECAKRSEELGNTELGQGLMKHFGVEE